MLFLFIHHMLGVRPSEKSLRLRPRLLTGLPSMDASLKLRRGRLNLSVRRVRPGEKPGYRINGESRPFRKAGIDVPLPADGQILKVEAVLSK
jgi:cellobiose phosphorylase